MGAGDGEEVKTLSVKKGKRCKEKEKKLKKQKMKRKKEEKASRPQAFYINLEIENWQ